MVSENGQPKKPVRRGRPPGRTERGEATRAALFDAAIELMGEQGYGATTLRQVAARAGVTHAVMYRYFPSKRAIVMELYRSLSQQLVGAEALAGRPLAGGPWRKRVVAATEASLDVLRPHRALLRSAVGVLVGVGEEGLFAPTNRAAREQVQGVFVEAVTGAKDCPRGSRGPVLGRGLDLLHLGIVLFWLLDASPKQNASSALLKIFSKALPLAQAALKLPGAWGLLGRLDDALQAGLMPGGAATSQRP